MSGGGPRVEYRLRMKNFKDLLVEDLPKERAKQDIEFKFLLKNVFA